MTVHKKFVTTGADEDAASVVLPTPKSAMASPPDLRKPDAVTALAELTDRALHATAARFTAPQPLARITAIITRPCPNRFRIICPGS